MNIIVWLYDAYYTISGWATEVFYFMSSSVIDIVYDAITKNKHLNFIMVGLHGMGYQSDYRAYLATWLPDVSVLELFIGGGTIVVLLYILVSWIIDLLP